MSATEKMNLSRYREASGPRLHPGGSGRMPVAQPGIHHQLAADPRKFYGAEQTVPPVYEGGSQQSVTRESVSRQRDQALNSDLRVFFRK